jgi:3',5'-cyclic AMP phosphodiesterase CpdA
VKVFACHHPLIDIEGAPVTGGVRRGVHAATLLAEAGVDLVLTGHVHVPFALPLTIVSEGCYAIGAGTLSQRTRGTPPSFSTIEVTERTFDVRVHAWTGERFEAGEPWRLPRRAARER